MSTEHARAFGAESAQPKQDADYVFFELTRSICPDCRKVIDAKVLLRDNKVYMAKRCPDCGPFEALVYGDAEMYIDFAKYNKPGTIPLAFGTEIENGCPLDCGLCPDHQQHACLGIIEVNSACNMNCPLCFASARPGFSLTMEEVDSILDDFVRTEGSPEVVQFSGGEPTIHPRIMDFVRSAKRRGIPFVMLNTNGKRIAKDDRFLSELNEVRPSLYFQFDGFDAQTYRIIRGEPNILDEKLLALDRLASIGLPVTLVPAIERGVNEHEIGKIIDFAIRHLQSEEPDEVLQRVLAPRRQAGTFLCLQHDRLSRTSARTARSDGAGAPAGATVRHTICSEAGHLQHEAPVIESDGGRSDLKQCCALFYGSDAARFFLGESFHPGGLDLTLALAGMMRLHASSTLLDVASGKGTSAFTVAERFGCRVVGIDLSEANVAAATEESVKRGLSDRVSFTLADAESLPFASASFDALLCECAFCTFPDKAKAASEFSRVLRPGGTLGLSDLTRVAGPLPELDGLLAWIACIGDAQPRERYADWLVDAGFTISVSAPKDECLSNMVEQVRSRLMLADIMIGLKKIEDAGLDLQQAKQFASAAAKAVKAKRLGYAVIVAERPPA